MVQVAAGKQHSMLLTRDGRVLVCGACLGAGGRSVGVFAPAWIDCSRPPQPAATSDAAAAGGGALNTTSTSTDGPRRRVLCLSAGMAHSLMLSEKAGHGETTAQTRVGHLKRKRGDEASGRSSAVSWSWSQIDGRTFDLLAFGRGKYGVLGSGDYTDRALSL